MRFIIVVSVCVLLGIVCTQAPTTCSLTANENGQVLRWLKNKEVVLNDEPKIIQDATICNGEFAKSGTCCDVASMKLHIEKVNTKFVDKWSKYIKRLSRIKNKFENGFKKIAKKMNPNDVKNKITGVISDQKLTDKFKSAQSILPSTDKEVIAMKEFVDKFSENIEIFKTQGKVCFEAMKVARANLLCAACSGRAGSLTTTQSSSEAKFRITLESCSNIVVKCFPVWKINFQLTSLMQYVIINNAKKKGDAACSGIKSEKEVSTSSLSRLKAAFSSCSLPKIGDTKLTCDSATSTVDEITKNLCADAISANNDNAYVEGDESIDSDVSDDEVENTDKDISEAKRILQSVVASSFDIGVVVDGTNTNTFNDLSSTNTAVVPSSTVTTSDAGNPQSSAAKIFTVLGLLLVVILVQFF